MGKSLGSRTSNPTSSTPSDRAAVSISLLARYGAIVASQTNPTRGSTGTASFRSSNSLPPPSAGMVTMPVMLPSGRAKLLTRPSLMGSLDEATITIGIVFVPAAAALSDAGPPAHKMTSTFMRTSSATRSGYRSGRPSTLRRSNKTFRPSTQPSVWSRFSNAATFGLGPAELVGPDKRIPTRRSLPVCCPIVTPGDTTTPTRAPMNTRRSITKSPGRVQD
jgi:hypothetical protein